MGGAAARGRGWSGGWEGMSGVTSYKLKLDVMDTNFLRFNSPETIAFHTRNI